MRPSLHPSGAGHDAGGDNRLTLGRERLAIAGAGLGPAAESCDYCGSPRLVWRKCKLVCTDCRQINKSCADL